MTKILVADDHEIFRAGIKQILRDMPGKFVIKEACSGKEVMEKTARDDFDLILLDISMPGRNGLDIMKQLKNINPNIKVLILSLYPEEQFAIRALKAGADGYLTKSCTHKEFGGAIKNVIKGGKYISAAMADRLASYIEADEGKALHENLSTREYEVMCLTAAGKPVKQIAMELSLSNKTISTYRSRIFDKLHVNNIAQLVQYAIQNRILDQLNK